MDETQSCSETLDRDTIDIILYNEDTWDAYVAIFISWFYYKNKFGIDRAERLYFEAQKREADSFNMASRYRGINQAMYELLKDKNVLILDLSYSTIKINRIKIITKKMFMIEHYSTSYDIMLLDENFRKYDKNSSCVALTWEYFFGRKAVPLFVKYIEDCELKSYSLPNIKEFVAFFTEVMDKDDDTFILESLMDDTQLLKTIGLEMKTKEPMDIETKNPVLVVHEINEKYVVVVYVTVDTDILISEFAIKILDDYSVADVVCIREYDCEQNNSLVYVGAYEKIVLMNISSAFDFFNIETHGKYYDVHTLILGKYNLFPFPLIDNLGLFKLFDNKETGTLTVLYNCSYVLFKADNINEKWLEEKYLQLIKKKFCDYTLIVFETVSAEININDNHEIVYNKKDYSVFYNEMSIVTCMQLLHMVCENGNNSLEFTSEKEFRDLFENPTTPKKIIEHTEEDGYDNIESSYESDSDCISE